MSRLRTFVVLIYASSLSAYAQELVMSQAAGTSRNPASAPMSMLMFQRGAWSLMLHGQFFLDHANASGPRGGKKTFSTNWMMASASRALGRGTLSFRSMLSLEPATITQRRYPELFQTGETAFGKQLIDGQHPHDFFMELVAEYVRKIGHTNVYIYAAPVGDPAFGPVAFPHRASAAELPQAPLTHHVLDSTHISYNVVTAGSISYSLPLSGGSWHTTAAWGRVYKEVHDRNLDGVLAESVINLWSRHYLTARYEVVDRDELFPHPILRVVPRPPQPVRVFRVRASPSVIRPMFSNQHTGGSESARTPRVINSRRS